MKPYMIIQGNSHEIEAFEEKIAEALEQGYSLAGDLIAHPHANELKFYQPIILEEDLDEGWEEEDEEEDED